MLAYLRHPEVTRFMADETRTLDDAIGRCTANRFSASGRFNVLFAIVWDDRVVGECHAWNVGVSGDPASPDVAEAWISYAIDPQCGGRGLATEAVGLGIEWLRSLGTPVRIRERVRRQRAIPPALAAARLRARPLCAAGVGHDREGSRVGPDGARCWRRLAQSIPQQCTRIRQRPVPTLPLPA